MVRVENGLGWVGGAFHSCAGSQGAEGGAALRVGLRLVSEPGGAKVQTGARPRPAMFMRRCRGGRCPRCGAPPRYGVTEEGTRWKVFVECGDERCGRKYRGGSIPRGDVTALDEV